MQKYVKKAVVLFLLTIAVVTVCVGLSTINAATLTASNNPVNLLYNFMGRYEFNYTGNTNHFDSWWTGSEQKIVSLNYKDRVDIASENNSTGKLIPRASDARIARAFLIWETRTSRGVNTPIQLYTPDNMWYDIFAQYACVDTRTDPGNAWSYHSMYCMAADITEVVKNAGYGNYTVANIPVWQGLEEGDGTEGTGGESVASWQLLIVEESESYEVRNVTLNIASKFYMEEDFKLSMSSPVASKESGIVNGQIFYGTSNSGRDVMSENYETFDVGGNIVSSGVANITSQAGLYKNGVLFNNRDSGTIYDGANHFSRGTIRMSLSEISDIGNDVTKLRMFVENDGWTTTFVMGMCYDINMYTVSYDGNGAPVGWTERTTCLFDKDYVISENGYSYKYHKFTGWNTKADGSGQWWYPGDTYKNLCTVSDGDYKLYAQWETLGAMITLDNQGADRKAGTPKYFEKYNDRNYTDDDCKTPITRIVLPEKTGYVFAGYYTEKNGAGIQYVTADGTITSTATTFTDDTTLYAKWEPGVYKITLNGINPTTQGTACYYEKYTVGNFADEACTTKITRITLPTKKGYTFDGYWTKMGGDSGGGSICVTTAGAICTRADQFTQDTTIYANWNPNTYTITCNNQGATTPGSACFYELYNVKFFYDTVVTTAGTRQIPFNYTGGVQYFTAPYTGIYTLDVYGAQGSSAYGTGGYGGRSYGTINLVQGETLYIYVGGAGSGKDGAGWNGGNYGGSFCWNIGAGGGATDIRRNGWALENRVIVAGGGGGGVATPGGRTAPGGNGGGYNYEPYYGFVTNGGRPQDDSTYNGPVLNPRANLAAQTAGQASGTGGGGGYYGGRTVPTIYLDGNNTIPAGEGGTGYVGGVSNGSSVAGVRSGNGYAVITRSNYTTRRYDTTKIDVPTKQGYYFRGYFTGTNGSGTAITDAKGKILVDPDYFTANATVYAYWSAIPEQNYTIVYDGNGATGGSMASVSVPVDVNYRLNTNLYTRDNYTFAGWSTSPAGGVAYGNNATVRNLTTPGKTITLYAVWKANTYTIRFHGNGETGGSMEDMRCDYGKDYRLTKNTFEKTGYHFVEWTTNQDGTGDGYSDGQTVNSLRANAQGIVHLYAQWEANSYTIVFDPNGGGAVTPIDGITVKYDEQLTLPDASGSYIKYTLDGVNVTQQVLDGDIVLDAAGVVVLMLDEESGEMVTPGGAAGTENTDGNAAPEAGVPEAQKADAQEAEKAETDGTDKTDAATDSTETDGTEVEETVEESTTEAEETSQENPEASAAEAVEENPEVSETEADTPETASVVSKEISRTATAAEETQPAEVPEAAEAAGQSEPETEAAEAAGQSEPEPEAAEQTEEAADEPQPDKKAYASVYMGWSLADGKDDFQPQWNAGEAMDASTVIDTAGVTNQDGAVITLYAVWDDCPWIQAVNLYYTLEQAQSGFITEEEILSHATASDREDGSPIAAGFHENGTSFSIPDYAPTDFTQFMHSGSSTENLTVVDSAGSIYSKMITVYVVDTTPVAVKPEGTTRFIDEYYYYQPYENGGLEDDSVWKTDPEYVAVITQAFENSRNDTPVLTYTFTHEEILEMREYVREHGIGNSKEEDALDNFYDLFMAPNLVE